MDLERPLWLRIKENGVLGEARTRAFLLERFWILERSIDIEGADLIVQRRSKKSLLGSKPPNLGYVQAKYFQDASTTQYVHQEYVLDEKGNTRGEFFLICHTGKTDQSQMFYLSARDIRDNFSLRQGRYVLPGRSIIDVQWEVANKKTVLDQMEQALIDADFASNRHFLSQLLPDEPNDDLILPEYAEGIESADESIRGAFHHLRLRAKMEAEETIKRLALLSVIVNTDDPLVAIENARNLGYLDDGYDFYSEDYERLIRREKERYEQLSKAGLLAAHSSLKEFLRREIIAGCTANFPFNADDVYFAEVSYDVHTLELISFTTKFSDRRTTPLTITNSYPGDLLGVEKTPCGVTIGFILWGRFFDTTELNTQDYNPCHRITAWVDTLLGYIMYNILDCWRYHNHQAPEERVLANSGVN